jgi:hypothetical protein
MESPRPYFVLQNSHGYAKEFPRNLLKILARALKKFASLSLYTLRWAVAPGLTSEASNNKEIFKNIQILATSTWYNANI